MIETTCKNCKKKFMAYPYRVKNGEHICCSYECLNQLKTTVHDPERKMANFHDTIQNNMNDFCYLVGLIVSDGHISRHNYNPKKGEKVQAQVTLHIRDTEILQKIQKIFGGVCKEYHRKRAPCAQWRTAYKPFIYHLCTTTGLKSGNKTFNVDVSQWFNILSKDQKRHFIRGVFDGGITLQQRPHSMGWSTSIVSASKLFCSMLVKHFENINIIPTLYSVKNKYYYLRWNKLQSAYDMLNYIYSKKNNLYMKRKYDKYNLILEDINQRKRKHKNGRKIKQIET